MRRVIGLCLAGLPARLFGKAAPSPARGEGDKEAGSCAA